jgi:hypothetical protein
MSLARVISVARGFAFGVTARLETAVSVLTIQAAGDSPIPQTLSAGLSRLLFTVQGDLGCAAVVQDARLQDMGTKDAYIRCSFRVG